MWPKYRSFDEFQRDEIKPGLRAGGRFDNINDPNSIELDFDEDPFERALLEHDDDDDDGEAYPGTSPEMHSARAAR